MSTKAKPKKSFALNGAQVIKGEDLFSPVTDTAFDIETGPLPGQSDGESLLSAETARVAAIGYYEPSRSHYVICYDADEAAMLRQFWLVYSSLASAKSKFIGFNILGFDLPFLIRRSWQHKVSVPKTIMSSGRYWSDTFVDLMILWRCGGYKDFISLDNLAKFLKVGGKNGNGELFHKLWLTDRDAAIAYLKNDVKLVIDCADRMGVVASLT